MTGYMRKHTKWILFLAALLLAAGTVLPAMAADEKKPETVTAAPAVAALAPAPAQAAP
ncbi:MAG: ammonia channel protein, partial [Deltaproteobacteria bacterium]|nr:ammonia channel protein [Deltaproteobacteria bacterium]